MTRWTEEELESFMKTQGKEIIKPKKKRKYKNTTITVDNIRFDSNYEANYYADLKTLERVKEIIGFCRQPQFTLQYERGDERPITYKPDFIIFHKDGSYEVIETKGFVTEEYILRRKLFKEKFPEIKFTEAREAKDETR